GVRVLMPFERRIAIRIHFEITQLTGQRVVVKQSLARDVFERCLAILLVWLVGHAIPAELAVRQSEVGLLFTVHGQVFPCSATALANDADSSVMRSRAIN